MTLIRFGGDLKINHPERIIKEMADKINQQLNNGLLFYGDAELKAAISKTLSESVATNNFLPHSIKRAPEAEKLTGCFKRVKNQGQYDIISPPSTLKGESCQRSATIK
ncbi:hypothetical protein [Superficieibacter sp.]|uniref:hypothetical protein n=1 Tax=Superficieibacter sp. TaxID=2303322 RepID=UPI0028A6AA7E|nr:hypothetical protein [Superficieibacter sp.]